MLAALKLLKIKQVPQLQQKAPPFAADSNRTNKHHRH